jgi:hypothetical protein
MCTGSSSCSSDNPAMLTAKLLPLHACRLLRFYSDKMGSLYIITAAG